MSLIAQNDTNFIDDTFKKYDLKKTTFNDSLIQYSYEDLYKKYSINKKDTNSIIYIKAYLRKAKKEKNEKELLEGFYKCLKAAKNENEILAYSDSLIHVSKELKNASFEAKSYYYKGVYYFKKRKYKLSLNNQLIADSINKEEKKLSFFINFNIGMVKARLGNTKEALTIFKKSFENTKIKKDDNYYKSLFLLSYTYRQNKQLDSAIYFCKLGIKDSKKYLKNPKYYYDFLLIKGIFNIDLGNIKIAEKNITKAQNYYELTQMHQPNLAFCYYYNSIIHKINKEYKKSIRGMQKVDSLYIKYGSLHPELRGAYEELISYYKSKKDVNNQLIYIERLLEIDNYTHNDYRYLTKNITDNYDTPKLLKRKEELIHSLSNKNKKLYLAFIPIILISSFLIYINYRKKRIYKQRLDKILQDTPLQEKEKPSSLTNKTELNISEELRTTILTGLDAFIDEKKYIEKDITVGSLSKKIGTNTKYLAAIIKKKHDKSFVRFINDLRIEYAIEQLKKDPKFRLYTIQGIAELSGFGHPESFTRAFVKKTGIKASYFLKNLN